MTHKEALEKLELQEGATASEIKQQYNEFYNEFQIRITNAPAEYQRTLYKKKLDALTLAFETLSGQLEAPSTEELPGVAESIPEKPEPKVASPVSDKPQMTKEKALQILGLGERFTEKELNNAFKAKVSACKAGLDNAITESIKKSYEEAITQCNAAHSLLKNHVYIPAPKVKTTSTASVVANNKSNPKKKWILPVAIVAGIGVVVLLILVNLNSEATDEKELVDPAPNVEYVKLKTQADLLATQGNWQDALDKYKAAYLLEETHEVRDSIESMENYLLAVSKEKEEERLLEKKEAKENKLKEAERLPQEKESKHIKIGDNYAGGIVFYVDESGRHGKVCSLYDLGGRVPWQEAMDFCANLTLNGYSDWYMPSYDEMKLVMYNVGPWDNLGLGNIANIGTIFYWSSSELEDRDTQVWGVYPKGGAANINKDREGDSPLLRPIRRF